MFKTQNKTIKVGLQLIFLLIAAQLVVWLIFWKKLPPQLPLFYSQPWGEKQLTSPLVLLILPAVSFLVGLFNLTLASLVAKKEKFASQLLMIFAAVFSLLCLITLSKIVTLVT